MLTTLVSFPIPIDTARIAGVALWSLALYLGFSPISDRVVEQIYRWLNIAGEVTRSTQTEHRPHPQRDAQYAFVASLLSVLPFLVVGGLLNYGVELGLGRSWAISVGMLACVSCGVYELGRRDGQAPD
ncbi:MAG: hypothetical protein ICV62_05140 [Cyanobacteria bacterium Co-bin13]|nr:hypothetical protein [Cyanobacteria bacterium Co-bin13]